MKKYLVKKEMSKLKKLPNHSIEAIQTNPPFTDDQCEQWKLNYNFLDEFNLNAYLVDAVIWYNCDNDFRRKASIAEQRTLIDEFGKCCTSLKNCVDNMGSNERRLLFEKTGKYVNFIEMSSELGDYSIVSEMIASQLEGQASPGQPQNTPLDNLIYNLMKIYEKGTGKEPKCYRHPFTSEYVGAFLDFTIEILKYLNIIRSRSTIADRIKKIKKFIRVEKGDLES